MRTIKDVKCYCNLTDKEINMRYMSVFTKNDEEINTAPECYENRKGKCIYKDNGECLERTMK